MIVDARINCMSACKDFLTVSILTAHDCEQEYFNLLL